MNIAITRKIITVAIAGKYPECIAEIPTRISDTSAAIIAKITQAINLPTLISAYRPPIRAIIIAPMI